MPQLDLPELTFDHVHLRTGDPDGMAAWFATMLGAEVIRSVQEGAPRVDLRLGGQKIFLMPVAPGEAVNPAPVTPYRGLDHFGFAVKDIDAVYAALKAKGATFTQELKAPRPGIKTLFLRGPEGVSVELLERAPK